MSSSVRHGNRGLPWTRTCWSRPSRTFADTGHRHSQPSCQHSCLIAMARDFDLCPIHRLFVLPSKSLCVAWTSYRVDGQSTLITVKRKDFTVTLRRSHSIEREMDAPEVCTPSGPESFGDLLPKKRWSGDTEERSISSMIDRSYHFRSSWVHHSIILSGVSSEPFIHINLSNSCLHQAVSIKRASSLSAMPNKRNFFVLLVRLALRVGIGFRKSPSSFYSG